MRRATSWALIAALLAPASGRAEFELSGYVGAEARFFWQPARMPEQADSSTSLVIKPEFYQSWNDGDQSVLFVPFVRLDQNDSRRGHVDVRELSYVHVGPSWELRTGLRRVFWGVAESNHLVDVINQTDYVENIDFEDKLGQPMVNLALIRSWGTLDLFVLPGFRERTFPGRAGRFQLPLRVDTSAVEYESAAAHKHVDYALRYSHSAGPFDVGLYHFRGTTREPRLVPAVTAAGEAVLAPVYELVDQTGLDAQATLDHWLLKLEALRRQGQGASFAAAVAGFEYTFVGILDSALDLGVLGEYHFDERRERTPTPFDHDVFVGARVGVNDAADSQLLSGLLADLDGGGWFVNVEASRRLGAAWKLEVELRLFLVSDRRDPLAALGQDDHLQLELQRYF